MYYCGIPNHGILAPWIDWERETIFTCPHTLKFRTRPLAGTASDMASDSVRDRGWMDFGEWSIYCSRGRGTPQVFVDGQYRTMWDHTIFIWVTGR